MKDPKETRDPSKSFRGNKGKRPKGKGASRKDSRHNNNDIIEISKVGSWQSKDNDVAWYTKYPQLVEAQSSVIFNKIMGSTYEYLKGLQTSSGKTPIGIKGQAIPGVVTLLFRPWACTKGTAVDAMNIASKNLYTFVRHANSGSVNYESSDLMQYVLCVMGLYTMVEQIKRDLRLALTFKATNRYAYKAVLRSYGYSNGQISYMITNYANLVAQLNITIGQLNSLKIPAEFNILSRRLWMVHNIWKDDSLDKATYFSYVTDGFYHYDWQNSQLTYNNIINITENEVGTNSISTRITSVANEINNLLAYEDIGIMIGDILKAYKAESCFAMSFLSLDEVIDAEFSDEMANQFRNATILCKSSDYGTYTGTIAIKQMSTDSQLLYEESGSSFYSGPINNGEYYFSNEAFKVTDTHLTTFNPPLVVNSDSPSNGDVILNTRLTVSLSYAFTSTSGPSLAFAKVSSCGTEVITTGFIWTYEDYNSVEDGAVTNNLDAQRFCTVDSMSDYSVSNFRDIGTTLSQLDQISFAPNHFVLYKHSTTVGGITYHYAYVGHFVKGKNVLELTPDWLANMHAGCQLSEFTIPMFKLLETV